MTNLSRYLDSVNLELSLSEQSHLLEGSSIVVSNFGQSHDVGSAFYQALFTDNFFELVDLITTNELTDLMLSKYAPDLYKKYGQDSFWELLYLELITLNNQDRQRFEEHVNGYIIKPDNSYEKYLYRDDKSLVVNYPFIVVFFGGSVKTLGIAAIAHDQLYVRYISHLVNKPDIIHLAMSFDSYQVVKLNLELDKADPFYGHKNSIKWIINRRCTDIMKLAIKSWWYEPDIHGDYSLRMASQNGGFEMVRMLLIDGAADPTTKNNKALRMASKYGFFDIVQLLLTDQRVDPTVNNNEALLVASERNYFKIVELLLDDGRVNPAADDNKTFCMACRHGQLKIVQRLLGDKRTYPVAETLQEACKNGHVEIAVLLLADSRVDPTDHFNKAFREACENGHVEIVLLLLDDGRIDPAALDNDYMLGLHQR